MKLKIKTTFVSTAIEKRDAKKVTVLDLDEPERGPPPPPLDVEFAEWFKSGKSAAATTEAASATSPNEAAIPEATLDKASASEDGFSSFGLEAIDSRSFNAAPTLSTRMGFLVAADTTLAPNVAIFFLSLKKK